VRAASTGRVAVLAGLLVVLDQASKAAVRGALAPGERVPLLGDVLSIVLRPNTRGVSWWVPDVPGWAPLLVTLLLWVVLVGVLPVYRFHALRTGGSGWATVAAVSLAGAAGGHVADGLFAPWTADWIQLLDMPAGNLADVYSWVGLAALAVEGGRAERKRRGMGLAARWALGRETRRDFIRFLRGLIR
jgi:signal peptidase II